jgi:hypothetical protein
MYCAVPDADPGKPNRNGTQEHFIRAKESDTLYADMEHGAPMLHDVLFVMHVRKNGDPQMATSEQMRTLGNSSAYRRAKRKNPNMALVPVKLQDYAIDYNIIDPRIRSAVAKHFRAVALEFAAAAYDDDGKLLNSILNQAVVSGNPSAQKAGQNAGSYGAVQHLEVPPGAASIRVSVRDVSTQRAGTIEVALPLKDESTAHAAAPTR